MLPDGELPVVSATRLEVVQGPTKSEHFLVVCLGLIIGSIVYRAYLFKGVCRVFRAYRVYSVSGGK